MGGPKYSFVIPTYRRPEALRRTLAALARQEVSAPWEVVVCDAGSPPEEAGRVRAAIEDVSAETPLPVRLIRQDNAGPAAARNAGARAAHAAVLIFLDDDCAPAPGFLAAHSREHFCGGGTSATGSPPGTPSTPLARTCNAATGDGSPAADVVVLGHVAWDPAVRVTPFMELVVRGAQFNYGAIADPERVPFTCFYTANCSLRRETLARAGWFDATLPPYMEDTEFAYRLMRSGAHIVYRPAALVYHEHAVELRPYLERQRRAGRAAVEVAKRHPELFDVVGVGEQFYSALLRYAFVLGVEEALSEQAQVGHITGEELRSRFEQWSAHWAVRQVSQLRALRQRVAALEREVARRDERLAEVTQAKDARIAELEAQLDRFHRLLPVRLYHAARRRLA